MKRVIVIGCPGSGKSTFSKKLKGITDLPLYHLDMMYWNEDKTTVLKEAFLKRLEDAMNNPEWIIDGNYKSSLEMRVKECDIIFFLDYDTEVCLSGIRERKGKKRSDIPWIETNYDEEFISFVKNFKEETRPEVFNILNKYSDKDIIIFKSREEADEYLESLI